MDQALLIVLFLGIFLGSVGALALRRMAFGSYKKLAADIVQRAESEAQSRHAALELSLKQREMQQQRELEKMTMLAYNKLHKEEERIAQREDKLESRMSLVEKKLSDIEKRETILAMRRERIDEEKIKIRKERAQVLEELQRTAGMTQQEAQAAILQKVSNEIKTDIALLTRRSLAEMRENCDLEAKRILTTAINRMAGPIVSEATVTTVSLPSDELKGRIIGKEGRNIRALELATGINFVIDETPHAVVLCGFDPIRKAIAKVALSELIQDGRIHPTRIEESVAKAKETIQKQIKACGEDYALRAGVINLHPELILLLGKLKFRFSFGQNVLDHSLEVSQLMGLMADELGLNTDLARRIGLLHDIGKAVSHEVDGSHAIVGYEMALRFGEQEAVASGIGCHHGEMQPTTLEGSLCSAADTLSAARPGARVEAVEHYIKRLSKLEEITASLPGVERVYAMQAGREVRIMVHPEAIDDDALVNLAREAAKRVEKSLAYPGKIKVVVIREKRAIEYAL